MKIQSYRMLLGVALAVLVGAVGAQTGGAYPTTDKASQATQSQQPESAPSTARQPATKDLAAPDMSSSPHTAPKMSSHSRDQAQVSGGTGISMHKPAKHAHHTAKRGSRPSQVASSGETIYRQALRQCVKEQDQTQRDSCLDNAIEQFQHNG
jgi:hypothetical protein